MYGENKHTAADNAAQADKQAAEQNEVRQARLNQILAAFRERLFPYKEEIQPWFASYDERQDGHCSLERFSEMIDELLNNAQFEAEPGDKELLMESFHDPDHVDQTRPQSIVVLDEALFG